MRDLSFLLARRGFSVVNLFKVLVGFESGRRARVCSARPVVVATVETKKPRVYRSLSYKRRLERRADGRLEATRRMEAEQAETRRLKLEAEQAALRVQETLRMEAEQATIQRQKEEQDRAAAAKEVARLAACRKAEQVSVGTLDARFTALSELEPCKWVGKWNAMATFFRVETARHEWKSQPHRTLDCLFSAMSRYFGEEISFVSPERGLRVNANLQTVSRTVFSGD